MGYVRAVLWLCIGIAALSMLWYDAACAQAAASEKLVWAMTLSYRRAANVKFTVAPIGGRARSGCNDLPPRHMAQCNDRNTAVCQLHWVCAEQNLRQAHC